MHYEFYALKIGLYLKILFYRLFKSSLIGYFPKDSAVWRDEEISRTSQSKSLHDILSTFLVIPFMPRVPAILIRVFTLYIPEILSITIHH